MGWLTRRSDKALPWVRLVLLSVLVLISWQFAMTLNGRLAVILAVALLLWVASFPLSYVTADPTGSLKSLLVLVVHYLGGTSFALFLVHFPVSMLVNAAQDRFDWTLPHEGVIAMGVAWLGSMVLADVFYRYVERFGTKLSRRIG